jgi:hypothetical protein
MWYSSPSSSTYALPTGCRPTRANATAVGPARESSNAGELRVWRAAWASTTVADCRCGWAPQLEVVGAPPLGREGRSPTAAFTAAALGASLPVGPSAVATSALPAASTVAALDTPPPAGPLRPTKGGNASSSLAGGAEQRPSRTAHWLRERHPCPAAVLPPPRFVPPSALNGSRRHRPWSSCRARARPSGDCLPATQTRAQALRRQPRSSCCARTSPAPLAASCRLSLRLADGHGGRARDGSSGGDGKSSRCALRQSSLRLGPRKTAGPRRGGCWGISMLVSPVRPCPVTSAWEPRLWCRVGNQRWSSPTSAQPHELLVGSTAPICSQQVGPPTAAPMMASLRGTSGYMFWLVVTLAFHVSTNDLLCCHWNLMRPVWTLVRPEQCLGIGVTHFLSSWTEITQTHKFEHHCWILLLGK